MIDVLNIPVVKVVSGSVLPSEYLPNFSSIPDIHQDTNFVYLKALMMKSSFQGPISVSWLWSGHYTILYGKSKTSNSSNLLIGQADDCEFAWQQSEALTSSPVSSSNNPVCTTIVDLMQI